MHKWTCAVETYVVQGPVVLNYMLPVELSEGEDGDGGEDLVVSSKEPQHSRLGHAAQRRLRKNS